MRWCNLRGDADAAPVFAMAVWYVPGALPGGDVRYWLTTIMASTAMGAYSHVVTGFTGMGLAVTTDTTDGERHGPTTQRALAVVIVRLCCMQGAGSWPRLTLVAASSAKPYQVA